MSESECPVEAVFPDQSLPCLLERGHEPPHKFTPDPCGQCGCLPDDPCCGSSAEPGCPCSEAGQDTATGTPDPVASALSGIRERAKAAADFPLAELAGFTAPDTKSIGGWIAASALDIPRLLAAAEAALRTAGEWEQDAAYAEARAERALDNGKLSGPATSALLSGRAQAKRDCADELRESITTALAGEEAGDGG